MEDDENDFQTNLEEKDVSDLVPAMPNDYYEKFEMFLSREPPKLKGDKKSKLKGKFEMEREVAQELTKKASVSLPLIPKKGRSKDELPPRPTMPNVSSKVASSSKPKKQKEIDPSLLMEAFAYAEQLAHQGEEDEEHYESGVSSAGQSERPPRPQLEPHPHSAPERKQSKSSKAAGSGGGVVKILRSKTQQSDQPSSSSSSSSSFSVAVAADEEPKRAAVDFDALVANFEQGITLQKLQAELKFSKQSMARSEEFMRQLARDFGGSKKGKAK